MLAPSPTLSPLQHRLLRELDLSDFPAPEAGSASFAARGLDADEVQDAVPALLWAGLVEQKDGDGGLALTPSGAAALYAAQREELEARLSAIGRFATTVARGSAPRSAGYALQCLAGGEWTLEQAEAYVKQSEE